MQNHKCPLKTILYVNNGKNWQQVDWTINCTCSDYLCAQLKPSQLADGQADMLWYMRATALIASLPLRHEFALCIYCTRVGFPISRKKLFRGRRNKFHTTVPSEFRNRELTEFRSESFQGWIFCRNLFSQNILRNFFSFRTILLIFTVYRKRCFREILLEFELWMRSSLMWMRSSQEWVRSSQGWMRSSWGGWDLAEAGEI